jgi:hypothetical protein
MPDSKSYFDIFKDIEPKKDGNIEMRFVASVQMAKVCAIEIVRQK